LKPNNGSIRGGYIGFSVAGSTDYPKHSRRYSGGSQGGSPTGYEIGSDLNKNWIGIHQDL